MKGGTRSDTTHVSRPIVPSSLPLRDRALRAIGSDELAHLVHVDVRVQLLDERLARTPEADELARELGVAVPDGAPLREHGHVDSRRGLEVFVDGVLLLRGGRGGEGGSSSGRGHGSSCGGEGSTPGCALQQPAFRLAIL